MNEQKRKYLVMWYDQNELVAQDTITASSKEEAERKAYLKYNGNPPAKMLSIVPGGNA